MEKAVVQAQVRPRASRNDVEVRADGSILVSVTAAPVDGAANEAVAAVVARRAGVARSAVSVLRGQRSRHKLLQVEGMGHAEVLRRLRRRAGEPADRGAAPGA